MSSLLIRNRRTVVTCDDGDRGLEVVGLLARYGVVQASGPGLSAAAELPPPIPVFSINENVEIGNRKNSRAPAETHGNRAEFYLT